LALREVDLRKAIMKQNTRALMPNRRPTPKQGTRGTNKTRKMQRNFANHILKLTQGESIADSAEHVGLTTNDIKNLRAGNMPGLRSLLWVVKELRVTPESLLERGPLRSLRKGTSMRNATEPKIKKRIQDISRESDPAELAADSGLSIASIYQYRSLNDKIGLHAFLAFVAAGHSPSKLLLGTK
jgi:hypothetical protein